MFLSKLKKLLTTTNFTKIQSIWLEDHLEAKNHHKSHFHQYLTGLKIEIWYYLTEISQNINMLTSAFFENF